MVASRDHPQIALKAAIRTGSWVLALRSPATRVHRAKTTRGSASLRRVFSLRLLQELWRVSTRFAVTGGGALGRIAAKLGLQLDQIGEDVGPLAAQLAIISGRANLGRDDRAAMSRKICRRTSPLSGALRPKSSIQAGMRPIAALRAKTFSARCGGTRFTNGWGRHLMDGSNKPARCSRLTLPCAG